MNQFSELSNSSDVCIVHDWLVAMRGGEKVLEAICDLFPEAPIYTLFTDKKKLSLQLQNRVIKTSFLQFFPGISNYYRWLLPLFPLAVYFMNVCKYKLVISSSHCVAKAVKVNQNAIHVCYCHTPMRYLWGFSDEYFGSFPTLLRFLKNLYFNWLKKWDIQTSQSIHFVANSINTAQKIKLYYGKKSTVIYPPVDCAKPIGRSTDNSYFLMVTALVPYKRVDLAITAFNQLRLPLNIVGDGPLRPELQKKIRHSEIQFLGWLNAEELMNRYEHCRALIFPGEEDFGIVPVECQMFGKPVIAYGKGGATETVLAVNDKKCPRVAQESTGLFFYDPSTAALEEAVNHFNRLQFNPVFIRTHAERFGSSRFKREFSDYVRQKLPPKILQ